MKCVILAAGYATRLYPLTENYPKPLLTVGDKTIIDWLIDDIKDHNAIDEFVIISNHKFVESFNQWKNNRTDIAIRIVDDGTTTNENRLGAVKDIQLAVELLGIKEDVFVLAGDNILDFSLKGFLDYANDKNASCVMCHTENELRKQQKTAIITVDDNGLITSYEEKPKNPKSNLAVPPFYYYKNEDIKLINEAINNGTGTDAPGSFAAWLSKQRPMYAYLMPGKRYDIGDLESYEYVKSVFS